MTLRSLFCRHELEFDKTAIPSAYEQMVAARVELYTSKAHPPETELKSIPAWSFKKTVIVVIHCKKCGWTKTVTETN